MQDNRYLYVEMVLDVIAAVLRRGVPPDEVDAKAKWLAEYAYEQIGVLSKDRQERNAEFVESIRGLPPDEFKAVTESLVVEALRSKQ